MSDHSPNDLPPVVRAAWVQLSADDAFLVFTNEIGAWWPLPTHGIFGARSGGVGFRSGELVEWAVDGEELVWAEVTDWQPGVRFSMNWHPGRNADEGTLVEVDFVAGDNGTQVIVTHSGWDVFGEQARERRNTYLGPNAWGGVLDHFGDCAEPGPAAADISTLRASYEAFFAEAELGGFGPAPAEGEWNAEQTMAHVALNDFSMSSVCQALVHGGEPRFENQTSQDPEVLARYIESVGDLPELISRARAASTQVCAAITRLSPEQLSTMVACHLTHDGNVVVDQPMPWAAIAIETQATRHLPAHVEQLRNLRPS